MNYSNRRFVYQVYTYFGRVLAEFPIHDDETHHHAARRAVDYAAGTPTTTWIRLV